MSEQLKESLSAVMDGEADEFEIRRVLDETSADTALKGVWERYHLVSSVLKRDGHSRTRTEMLTARMWAQIDREGANVPNDAADVALENDANDAHRRLGVWGQRIAGVAVAAGVAAAIIVGFRPEESANVSSAQMAVVAPAAPAPAALIEPVESAGSQAVATLDVQRAHAYMLHHAHHVALNNRSVVPFVKVAAYESK